MMMRFLADESCDFAVVRTLKRGGRPQADFKGCPEFGEAAR